MQFYAKNHFCQKPIFNFALFCIYKGKLENLFFTLFYISTDSKPKKKKRNSLHVFLCILLRRTHSESFGKRQWTLHDLELLRTFISLTKKPCFWQTVSLCQICKKTFPLQNQKTNNQIMETLYLNKKKSFQGFFIP